MIPPINNIYFLETALHDNLKYTIQGRVYSALSTGDLFTICYKTIDDTKYLVWIDNLDKKKYRYHIRISES